MAVGRRRRRVAPSGSESSAATVRRPGVPLCDVHDPTSAGLRDTPAATRTPPGRSSRRAPPRARPVGTSAASTPRCPSAAVSAPRPGLGARRLPRPHRLAGSRGDGHPSGAVGPGRTAAPRRSTGGHRPVNASKVCPSSSERRTASVVTTAMRATPSSAEPTATACTGTPVPAPRCHVAAPSVLTRTAPKGCTPATVAPSPRVPLLVDHEQTVVRRHQQVAVPRVETDAVDVRERQRPGAGGGGSRHSLGGRTPGHAEQGRDRRGDHPAPRPVSCRRARRSAHRNELPHPVVASRARSQIIDPSQSSVSTSTPSRTSSPPPNGVSQRAHPPAHPEGRRPGGG